MQPHSLEEDEKFEGTFNHRLTHVLSSEEYNSSWDKLQNSARKKMLTTTPQRSNNRLRTLILISLLVSQSIGVIGFFTSVFMSLKPYVSSDYDHGYQSMLGYLVGDFHYMSRVYCPFSNPFFSTYRIKQPSPMAKTHTHIGNLYHCERF
jgi:hypothetical protein